MGFIDYVVEYFKGPAGADGATGPQGPAGPGQVFVSYPTSFFETAGETVPAGDFSRAFTIPAGARLLSVQADTIGSDPGAPYALPAGSNITVAQTDNTHFTATLHLTADALPGPGDPLANCVVVYYLP